MNCGVRFQLSLRKVFACDICGLWKGEITPANMIIACVISVTVWEVPVRHIEVVMFPSHFWIRWGKEKKKEGKAQYKCFMYSLVA